MRRTVEITPVDLIDLTRLSEGNRSISDLDGLPPCVGLQHLDLGAKHVDGSKANSNQITDLSPLPGLTNLKLLYLSDNQIRDITPLVVLTGTRGADISGNHLDLTRGCPSMQIIKVFEDCGGLGSVRATEATSEIGRRSSGDDEPRGRPNESLSPLRDAQAGDGAELGPRVCLWQTHKLQEDRPAAPAAILTLSELRHVHLSSPPPGEKGGSRGYALEPMGSLCAGKESVNLAAVRRC